MADKWLENFYKNNPRKDPKNTWNSTTGEWSHEKDLWNPKQGKKSIYNTRHYNTQPTQQQLKGTNAMADYELPNFRDITFGENLFGNNKSEDEYFDNYQLKNMINFIPADEYSLSEQRNAANIDPFQDFKWGMNMPTFKVAKGAFDTAGTIFDAYNKFRNFGLREDMFEHEKRVGERDYLAAKDLQNVQFDKIDFNREERNAFKKAYGGPEGDYLMEDPVNRRALV